MLAIKKMWNSVSWSMLNKQSILVIGLENIKITQYRYPVFFFIIWTLSATSSSVYAKDTSETLIITGVGDHHPLIFKLPNGEPAGLYVDIWNLWSKSNGIPIEFNLTTMQQGLQLVKNKQAIHSGLFKSELRDKWADFSIPFHKVSSSIFYKKTNRSNNNKKKTLKDFHGKIVAVLRGSYQEQYLLESYPLIKVVNYSQKDSFIQLFNEEIHAIFDETPAMKSIVAQLGLTGVFESIEVSSASKLVHATLARGQPILLKKINQGFENIPLNLLISLENKWLPEEPKFFREKAQLNTLTLKEQKWLMQYPKLVSPIELNAYPYSFEDRDGQHRGAWVDYLALISQRLNINIETNGAETWNQALNTLKNNQSDFIIGITKSPERLKHFYFTKPFFSYRPVIIMKEDSFFIESMNGLNGKKLGIINGYIEVELIREDYPDIDIVLVNSALEGMNLTSKGELDAYIDSLDTINREFSNNKHNDLIIASTSPYNLKLSIAVKKELKPLVSILNKVIDSIDEKTRSSIGNNWLSVHSNERTDIKTILYWVIPILLSLAIIILIILKVNKKLINEITYREKMEKERGRLESQLIRSQKMEAVGNLAGGIAHDFNNILGIIVGNVELTRMNLHDIDKVQNYNDNIYKASDRAKKLVSQIMTFSRMDITSFRSLKLSPTVNECVNLIRSTSPANIEFITNINQNKDFIIKGDETQITQVLINLCTNAIHAMSENGGKLTVSLCHSPSDKMNMLDMNESYYELSISDTGCGIDGDIVDNIFDPFFSTKEVGKGTGLGLSVVHSIIKQHHGDITVESVMGKGTTFTIFLPQSIERLDEIKSSVREYKTGEGHILVVEDEEELRTLYKEQLETIGYKVTTCSNGQEALSVFKKKPTYFDLVLTDHSMPGITGRDLAIKILTIQPNFPIIIATGYADLMSIDEMKSMGVKKCLIKPLKIDELNGTIQCCL